MVQDEFFLDQLTDQKDDKHVFKNYRKGLVLAAHKKQQDYEFRGRVYPSSLYWSMCPMEFVKNIRKGTYFKITHEGEEKKARGSARHTIIQDALMPLRYYYGNPVYPQFILDELERKKSNGDNIKALPEYYVHDPDWLTSGWVDFPAREKGKLVIVDFKFTNILPKDWEEERKRLPTEKQHCQLYLYHVHTKKHKYFDQDPSGIRLAVFNNLALPELLKGTPLEDLDPELEWYSDIDPIKEEMTIHLLDECGKHVKQLLADEFEEVCSYRYCNKHKEDISKL